MGTTKKKKSAPSSDHEKWEVIFNNLKLMLRKQKAQLDSLLEERDFLQSCIQSQVERWNSDALLLEDVISQTRKQLLISELGNLVEIAKADFLVASKQRYALSNKLKLEHVQSELDDFRAWFDILSHRCPDKENISLDGLYESLKAKGGSHITSTSKEGSKQHLELEKEVARLKRDYEKLSVKHKSDVSALQDEKNFVWNQYRAMEGSYTNQLHTKNDEIIRANERIMNLLTNMEQLQSAAVEKEETVTTLRANVTKLEAEVRKKDLEMSKKDGEMSKLSKELELLRSKITDIASEPSSSALKGKRIRGKRLSSGLEEEATSTQLQVTVSTQRAKLRKLEADANQKSEKISAMSKELKFFRSKSSADTPVLRRCINEPSASKSRGGGNGKGGGTVPEEEVAAITQLEATAATRRVRISELEAETQKDNGIFSVSKKLKLSRSESPADTPALRRSTRQLCSRPKGRENSKDPEGCAALKEKTSAGLVSEQGARLSKRKRDEDTPRLFTSQFKIPRLRSQSPRGR